MSNEMYGKIRLGLQKKSWMKFDKTESPPPRKQIASVSTPVTTRIRIRDCCHGKYALIRITYISSFKCSEFDKCFGSVPSFAIYFYFHVNGLQKYHTRKTYEYSSLVLPDWLFPCFFVLCTYSSMCCFRKRLKHSNHGSREVLQLCHYIWSLNK